MKTFLQTRSLETQVHRALRTNDLEQVSRVLTAEHPADVADVIDRLSDSERVIVFQTLPPEQAAAVLGETGFKATRTIIQQLPTTETAHLLDRMPPDDVAEILGQDIPERQSELLEAMQPTMAAEVRKLLIYPPESAGRLMTEEFVRVTPEMRAGEAMDLLRRSAAEVETITDLYMLDDATRLTGVITLRELIQVPARRRLADIPCANDVQVAPETDQEEVARLVSQYDLFALPVVDPEGRMLGIVTVDDVIDVLVEEGTEDVLRFGAVERGATDESYFATPITRAVRRRVGWLLLLFLTGTITINVLSWFETALNQVVALSFFIPLLIGTGGNTGAQTVSTMVRGMALNEIRLSDIWRVILREIGSGLLLGLLLALVALGMALLLGNSLMLALVVAISIIAICTWANTVGAIVPMITQKFGLDPALVSAPLITTLVDATGLMIYLLIARALLNI